ncbi:MAG: hypothetical protein MJZ95_03760 [Paludibacteraceae bacterium]|nr:hypothetical protein [Paludibacteraceae bacterium]
MAENVNPVTLCIDGFAEREVISVDYRFEQTTDVEGQLSGIPRGGIIVVRVKALNDGNTELLSWMLDPYKALNVKVKFLNTVNGSAKKTLEGTECYCSHYTEKWEDKQMHYEEISIVCRVLKNGNVEANNPWK